MRRLIAILMLLSGGMVLTNVAAADDAADVKAAVLDVNAALNAGDVDTVAKYIHPDSNRFNLGGRLLIEGFNKDRLKTGIDDGLNFNRQIRHISVKVYGNAAVVTGYLLGSVTYPNGTISRGTRRFSEVWIKQQGKWIVVHRHDSQLEPRPRELIPPPAATDQ